MYSHSLIDFDYKTVDNAQISNAKDLSRYVASTKKQNTQSCFSSQLLTLSMSNSFNNTDGQCFSKKLVSSINSEDLTFKDLITNIVKSNLFQSVVKGQ